MSTGDLTVDAILARACAYAWENLIVYGRRPESFPVTPDEYAVLLSCGAMRPSGELWIVGMRVVRDPLGMQPLVERRSVDSECSPWEAWVRGVDHLLEEIGGSWQLDMDAPSALAAGRHWPPGGRSDHE